MQFMTYFGTLQDDTFFAFSFEKKYLQVVDGDLQAKIVLLFMTGYALSFCKYREGLLDAQESLDQHLSRRKVVEVSKPE